MRNLLARAARCSKSDAFSAFWSSRTRAHRVDAGVLQMIRGAINSFQGDDVPKNQTLVD
jgi:hypothetical protein